MSNLLHTPMATALLSRQERNILLLASEGYSNQEIGRQLFIAECTVKRHRQNIMRKLGLKGKVEMTKFLRHYKP